MKIAEQLARTVFLCLLCGLVVGCQTAYYSIWETLGQEKRDLLRSNVETVQGEQREAADEFESALDRLRHLYAVDAEELEKEYDRLKADYERAQGAAAEVRDRVDKINAIATDLFDEWERELSEISSPDLQAKSRRKLTETKGQFASLAEALKKSENGMKPVLVQLNDYVLFLKHNLNAAAISSLRTEIDVIESDIGTLIADMRESIAEADRFLSGLPQ